MKLNQGWIPYPVRNREQRNMTNEFHEQIGHAGLVCNTVQAPDRVLLHELEIKATGALMPRIHQVTGSCVGCGAARAYSHAQCGDVVQRGDMETIKLPFPFATYGIGRQLGGMRSRGEGSFGSAQAKAVQEFGMLAFDYPGLPQPNINRGWWKWTRDQELAWSFPTGWPIQRRELEPEANLRQIQAVTRVKTPGDLVNVLAQGYGVTMACSFGTRGCRVQGDVLVADWNSSWAHQQDVSGYWQHPTLGLLFAIDNQWNDVHGSCPTLSKLGVNGSYWIKESVMERIMSGNGGEVYAHSNTEGFPTRTIDWGNLGIS